MQTTYAFLRKYLGVGGKTRVASAHNLLPLVYNATHYALMPTRKGRFLAGNESLYTKETENSAPRPLPSPQRLLRDPPRKPTFLRPSEAKRVLKAVILTRE